MIHNGQDNETIIKLHDITYKIDKYKTENKADVTNRTNIT